MTTSVAVWLLLLAFLYAIYQWGVQKMRCHYCGQVRGHDPHCPYQGVD